MTEPYILCDDCFRRLGKREEKTCTHGVYEATCSECGATRVARQKPYWHCLGDKPKE